MTVPTDDEGYAIGRDGQRVDMTEGASSWVEYDEETRLAVTRHRDGRVVQPIDVPADLNFVDDDNLNLARAPEGRAVSVGDVVTAGGPSFWTWVVIVEVDDAWVRFRPVDQSGPL